MRLVVLVDSSVLIDWLNQQVTPQVQELDRFLDLRVDLACCGPIRMEVLQGIRSLAQMRSVERLLAGLINFPTGEGHFDQSAALYRRLRAVGITIRRSIDCLIAAIAIDQGALLLASDRDFRLMTPHCPLRLWTEGSRP